MTKANDLASLLDANGDVVSSALDNVPSSDLVNDTTPQLGGTLDLNSNNITGTGNLDVTGTVDISNSSGATLKLTSTDVTGADTELLGQIDFVSSDASGGSAGTQARIKGVYEDNGDSSGIAFLTGYSTGSGSPTINEVMRIRHEGNVGIGQSNPAYLLTAEGDKDTWISRIYNTGSDANAAGLLVRTDATAAHDALAFGVYADSGYKFIIRSNGRVGIGTVSPDETVQVFQTAGSGNNYNEGTLKVGGQSTVLGFQFGYHGIGSGRNVITSLNNGGGANQRISIGFGAVNSSGEPATNVMTLNQSGYVGIGTDSPTRTLTVNSGATNTAFRLESTDAEVAMEFYDGSATSTIQGGTSGITFSPNTTVNEAMRVTSAGKLCIGTQSPVSTSMLNIVPADINRIVNTKSYDATTQYHFVFQNHLGGNVGKIQVSTSATAFVVNSDYRLKTDVTYDWDATTRLKQLKPARFKWIIDGDDAVPVDGFIAHEVQDIVPESISGTKDAMIDEEYEVTPAVLDDEGNEVTPAVMGTRSVPDWQGIDQSKLVPLLVKTIQELEARITALETAE